MKLTTEDGRMQIVDNVIRATYCVGGDGWSIIVCRFVDILNVVSYIEHNLGWSLDTVSENYFIFNNSNEAITVLTWEEYKRKTIDFTEKNFDAVLVII